MKRAFLSLALLLTADTLHAAPNDGFIWVNLSFKAIRNPADGSLPPYVSQAAVDEAVAHMNLMLAQYGRGYRVRLAEPVRNIGTGTPSTDPSNPSRWYDWSLASTSWDFRADSYTNYPANYGWNLTALNIFMMVGIGGGFCGCPATVGPTPPAPSDQIINGSGWGPAGGFSGNANLGAHLLHETGHFFNLIHTHGGTECYTDPMGNCITPPLGDDAVSDTLGDIAPGNCACNPNIDSLARLNFNGTSYPALPAHLQAQCNLVWSNVMSYHERLGLAQLSEGQLDRWADAANSYRHPTASGYTLNVASTGADANSGLMSAAPKRTVASAVLAAQPGGGDIVLLRPGSYNEQFTANKPVTLRATRLGSVTIGR